MKTRLGTLKVSSNNHQVPKLLWVENGRIPADHREKLSAKVCWKKYRSFDSFVSDNFVGQKLVRNDKPIPFGYERLFRIGRKFVFYG